MRKRFLKTRQVEQISAAVQSTQTVRDATGRAKPWRATSSASITKTLTDVDYRQTCSTS